MSREKDFAKNTLILFIGKFATQFSSLLLIPLFTHYLLTDDYGLVDLLQTYIALFVPILTMRMDSAIFRFLIDSRNNKDKSSSIISNAVILTMIMAIVTTLACFILSIFIEIKYLPHIFLNLIIMMFSNVFLQILRGMGKNKQYSISSILSGLINVSLNMILILFFHFKADSILIASSIANIGIIIYIIIVVKLYEYVKFSHFNKNELKKLLKYSIPMIPNSLSWWVVNVSDRTIISLFIGTTFNGIYTVSCKFSNLINSIFSIFNISWQETASLHVNDKDSDVFFSNMINEIFFMFSGISLLINALLPLFYNLLVGFKYISSYNYIPILLYANMWNIFISLLGGIYIALKKTKQIAYTTIVSAIINIIINFFLIKYIGLYAACLSTLISYFVMAMYRYFDIRKYIIIKFNIKKLLAFTFVFLISTYLYFLNNFLLNVFNFIFVFIFSLVFNKKILLDAIELLKSKLSRKKINSNL